MANATTINTGNPLTATGVVKSAVVGTALPTDATTELDPAFISGGYAGEDGITKSIDASDEPVIAMGGDPVTVVRQDHTVTYSWTFLESSNADTLKMIFGEDNVTVGAGKIAVRNTRTMVPRRSWVFELKSGENKLREVAPDAQLALSGEVQFVHSAVISYTVTLTTFADENEVKSYTYIDGPNVGTPVVTP